jgi:hypothetical protein
MLLNKEIVDVILDFNESVEEVITKICESQKLPDKSSEYILSYIIQDNKRNSNIVIT